MSATLMDLVNAMAAVLRRRPGLLDDDPEPALGAEADVSHALAETHSHDSD